ncbi:hypothetical protein KTH88_05110 [Acinetobacter baumannii]|nr:hypothetical protein [Acinetobacter baumannii]MCT9277742.1 hypothetical protein [Acinetobacter baumannii]
MLKTIVEFKFDDYQLYDQNLSAEDGNTLVQKTEDIAQYIYSRPLAKVVIASSSDLPVQRLS